MSTGLAVQLVGSEPSSAPAARSRALTTRFADFWLLGGASVAIWLAMIVGQFFRSSWAVDQHFKNLTLTTASLSLLVNYPHFLISYKLAYTRGRSFITSHWWQLVAVPLLLVAVFAWAFVRYDVPVARFPIVTVLQRATANWGSNARVFSGPRLGDLLFTLTFHVMVLSVGWHYTKQVFGCMMVYARFDGYPLSNSQRLTLKWALFSLWWLNYAYANVAGTAQTFSQFRYYSFDLPDVLVPVMGVVVTAGIGMVVYTVFWRNYRDAGRAPSLNMVIPFVALYIWWLPITRQFEFYFLLTPLFHSLQYLAFVYKMEDGRLRGLSHPEVRGTLLMMGVVLAGWLAFEMVPNQIDTALGTFNSWQMFFFFTAAMLFINIHHYFIDNVIWRFKDPEVKKYLLA
jgi:hypothetical protein